MKNFFKPADLGFVDPVAASVGGQAGQPPLALVVGAGFGGLAAAIRLSVMGYRVQILEKLDAAGGDELLK